MATITTRHTSDVAIVQVAEIDAAYTVAPYDTVILGKTAGGAFTATLCKAAQVPRGHEKVVKKIDSSANDLTLAAASGDKIDGADTKVLGAQYDYIRLISDGGTNWYVGGAVLNT